MKGENDRSPRQITELVQFKIVEKPYEIEVPKYIPVEFEKPVYVEKIYEIPVPREVQYEKPIVNERQMTNELTTFVKEAVTRALNEAIAGLKFSYEIPMPRIMKVERPKPGG